MKDTDRKNVGTFETKHRGIFLKRRGVLLETPRCLGRWTAVCKRMTAVDVFVVLGVFCLVLT